MAVLSLWATSYFAALLGTPISRHQYLSVQQSNSQKKKKKPSGNYCLFPDVYMIPCTSSSVCTRHSPPNQPPILAGIEPDRDEAVATETNTAVPRAFISFVHCGIRATQA